MLLCLRLGYGMTTCLGKSFILPFVNVCQYMFVLLSILILERVANLSVFESFYCFVYVRSKV